MKTQLVILCMLTSLVLGVLERLAMAEQGIVDVSSVYEETTDGIYRDSTALSFRNHRRDPLYAFPDEALQAWDWRVQSLIVNGTSSLERYRAYRVAGGLGRKFSNQFYLDSTLGVHLLKRPELNRSSQVFIWEAQAFYQPIQAVIGALKIGRDYIHKELLPGGVTSELGTFLINPQLFVKWSDRVRSSLKASFHLLSDSNFKKQIDIGTLYGISPGWPWIWFGVGGELTAYDKAIIGYWAPSQFIAFGPRAEASCPVIWDFNASIGANVNKYYDQDIQVWGGGYYLSARLQYGKREAMNASLGLNRSLSSRDGYEWASNEYVLSFSSPLF